MRFLTPTALFNIKVFHGMGGCDNHNLQKDFNIAIGTIDRAPCIISPFPF
jgi:hypothetical protein